MQTKETQRKYASWLPYLAVLSAILITVTVSWFLYEHTVKLLTENLRGQLVAIVKTAAVEFDPNVLDKLNVENDYKKPEWALVVKKLIKIRETNNDVVFAYILRKSENNPNEMVFVADSHSLNPYAKIDLDGNGIIDDADALNWPGQLYEDVPPEAFEGYITPTTNKELYEDQWGILISGYAPIKDFQGNTSAIMVVDMRADNFFKITRQTLFPFTIFIVSLIVILLIQAGSLIRISNKRISLMAELDRQKDELLSMVSHQLAAPITSIKWYLESLLSGDDGKLQPQQEETMKSMSSISSDLSDLVGMILDVSRLQLGKIKIDKQQINLEEFFKEILDVIEPKAKANGVILEKILPHQFPSASLDKRLTRMTIENLLTNAVKFTPKKGRVTLEVKINNGILSCTIKDTGCGIPKSEQANIFGKLFRASNVRDKIDGNGFGLYISKGAVENQGGQISFTSTEGVGTTFNVKIPI